jgi:hypothetical protein
MRASIVNTCSRVGAVKVNKWFTLRSTQARGTLKPLQKRSFRSDRQHFQSRVWGAWGLDQPFKGNLGRLLFDSRQF